MMYLTQAEYDAMTAAGGVGPDKPKKGEVIWVCNVWCVPDDRNDYTAAVSVRELRVESWGKQQATFTDVATGEFIRERGYTPYIQFSRTWEGLAPLIEKAVGHIRRSVEGSIAASMSAREHYGRAWVPATLGRHERNVASLREALERVGRGEVRVELYSVLSEEVRRQFAAPTA